MPHEGFVLVPIAKGRLYVYGMIKGDIYLFVLLDLQCQFKEFIAYPPSVSSNPSKGT